MDEPHVLMALKLAHPVCEWFDCVASILGMEAIDGGAILYGKKHVYTCMYLYMLLCFVIAGLGMLRKEVEEVIWTRFSRCKAKSNIAMGNVCKIATDWPTQKVNNMVYNFVKR